MQQLKRNICETAMLDQNPENKSRLTENELLELLE